MGKILKRGLRTKTHETNRASGRLEGRGSGLPYLPGLDGLRALAVLGVLLYHADLTWIPGGFLGVEVFFVISGYLITSLLLAEWRRRGHIDFKAFWLRRARRLLPAVFLLIASTLAFAVLFLPHEVAGLRGDALAAFGYVTNWYLVLSHKSYFETVGRPSLLRHLWSLAVEEQFYLLWPLLFAAGMRFLRHRRMLVAVIAGAAASTTLMVVLYRPDIDPSRVYYGTDTRAAALLIGAALALMWVPEQLQGRVGRANALLLDVIGLGGLGALVGFCLRLDEFQPFLYRGGFALVALATVVVIAVVVHPRARLVPSLLSQPLLRWVGLRSYGIYLWHWPVFMVTRPQLDVRIDGLPLLALRLVATGVLAELSYHYVEMPIRTGALGRTWSTLREAPGGRRQWLGVRWAGVAGVIVALSVMLSVSVAAAPPPAPPAYLSVAAIQVSASDAIQATAEVTSSTTLLEGQVSPTPSPALPTQVPAPAADVQVAQNQPMPTIDDLPSRKSLLSSASGPPPRVTAIGDSVMLGAVGDLQQAIPNLDLDAAVGRQATAAIGLLRARRAAGKLGAVVVVHIGDNGTFSARQFDEMMQVLADVRKVVFVNDKVPRPWETLNNSVLVEGVKRYPNAVLVDWRAASLSQPDLFWNDGIHLRPEGARAYAGLIAAYINAP